MEKRSSGGLSKQAVKEELDEFKAEWRKERKNYGHFVPATALYTTSHVLRELEMRHLIQSDGFGFAPY